MGSAAAQRQRPPVSDADALFHTYADMVYRLAYLRTRSASDAEDVLQEVFVRCLRKKPEWTDAEHQKAWFLRVTINCTKSLLTSAFRRHTASLDESAEVRAPSPDETQTDVYEAVLSLEQKYRTVIHLFYYEGYSVRDIAALTESTESAVKSRLFRGRELLRQRLKEAYDEI